MNKFFLSIVLLFGSFQVFAYQDGCYGHVKEVYSLPGEYDVDMGTTHYEGCFYDSAELIFPKESGSLGDAVVVSENLSTCELTIKQDIEGEVFTVDVLFDVENDGGYNSCVILVEANNNYFELHLGAVVGE